MSEPRALERLVELTSLIPASWPRGDLVLVGSACLAVRGFRPVRDVDVLVRPESWSMVEAALVKPGSDWEQHPGGELHADTRSELPYDHMPDNHKDPPGRRFVRLDARAGYIDLFDGMPRLWQSLSFGAVLADATEWRGFRVVSLRHCLAVKALADRSVDYADMRELCRLIEAEENLSPF